MTHGQARELLLDLAYGEVGEDERRALEEHLAGCAECAAELAGILSTREAAARLPDPGLPGGRDGILEAARRAVAAPGRTRRPRWSRPAAWVAAAATVVVVGGLTLKWLGEAPRRQVETEEVVAVLPAAPVPGPAPAPGLAPAPVPAPGVPPAASEAAPAREKVARPSTAPSVATPRPAAAPASREMTDARAEERAAAGASPSAARARRGDDFPEGTTGAFVALDLAAGTYFRVNPGGCATRHSPFSTFKIPSSLIALETGVVKDPGERWRWDADRYPPPSPAPGGDYVRLWQQDQDLRTALSRSIVWFFREAATRVGEPRMRQWLHTFHYGNEDLSGGIDRFWLGSSLRISPDEQVAFLADLQRGRFPVAKANLELVKEILVQESGPDWRLVAKTGSSFSGEGWLVGWVERAGGGCAFALHLQARSFDEMAGARGGIARDLLRRAGCLPP
jgi:beta-lactamase class D